MRRALVAAGVAAAGVHAVRLDGVFAVERDELVPQIIPHGVEGDGEVDAEFGAGAVHHGDHAGGGEGDAAAGQADAFAVHGDAHGFGDVFVIVQRLAHAHEHDCC